MFSGLKTSGAEPLSNLVERLERPVDERAETREAGANPYLADQTFRSAPSRVPKGRRLMAEMGGDGKG